MPDWLTAYLIWFLVGVVFLLAEMSAPGFVLVFFAIGCWLTAGTAFLWDISLTTQLIVFIAASLVSLFSLRRYFIKTFRGGATDAASDGFDDSPAGGMGTVTKAISPPHPGEIKYRGSFWPAYCEEEVAEGSSVRIKSRAESDTMGFEVQPIPDK